MASRVLLDDVLDIVGAQCFLELAAGDQKFHHSYETNSGSMCIGEHKRRLVRHVDYIVLVVERIVVKSLKMKSTSCIQKSLPK